MATQNGICFRSDEFQIVNKTVCYELDQNVKF